MNEYWIKGGGTDEPIQMNLEKNVQAYEEAKRIYEACRYAPNDGVKKRLADNERRLIEQEKHFKNMNYMR